ncbi:hypothetical protein, partial, partial [Absidia glauca]
MTRTKVKRVKTEADNVLMGHRHHHRLLKYRLWKHKKRLRKMSPSDQKYEYEKAKVASIVSELAASKSLIAAAKRSNRQHDDEDEDDDDAPSDNEDNLASTDDDLADDLADNQYEEPSAATIKKVCGLIVDLLRKKDEDYCINTNDLLER